MVDGYGRWIPFIWELGRLKAGGLFGWDYLYATHELACLVVRRWRSACPPEPTWGGSTSAVDGVDGNDAVLGMTCAVGTGPEVLGARQGFELGWLIPRKVMLLGVYAWMGEAPVFKNSKIIEINRDRSIYSKRVQHFLFCYIPVERIKQYGIRAILLSIYCPV